MANLSVVVGRIPVSDQTIYTWRRQRRIDTGQIPGTTSSDVSERGAARRCIAEPEAELERGGEAIGVRLSRCG
jgi:transposase